MPKLLLRTMLIFTILLTGTLTFLSVLASTPLNTNDIRVEDIPPSGNAYRPDVSGAGNLIVFDTTSSIVDEDTNFRYDVYIYNRQTAQYIVASRTYTNTLTEKCNSKSAVMSEAGQIAFISDCEKLVSNNTIIDDAIFWRDLSTGINKMVSVSSNGEQANFPSSYYPNIAISGNGQYIAFTSEATNLVSNDTNNEADVFVHNVSTGETVRVSVASDGTQGNHTSFSPSLSHDGRYVSFSSYASNLTNDNYSGGDFFNSVFLHDLQTGVTKLVSMRADGTVADESSGVSDISGDGRYIAFGSNDNFHSSDTDTDRDIYIKDMTIGNLIFASNLSVDDDCQWPKISADGRYVAYQCLENIYRFDRLTNEIIKVDDDGDDPIFGTWAENVSISADGNVLVYEVGSKTQIVDYDYTPPVSTPTELNIESVNFKHQSVSTDEWVSINSSTTEGNVVRIVAEIKNDDTYDGPAQINFIRAGTNPEEVIGTIFQSSFPVGEVTSVSYDWDTSGFAWDTDGSPHTAPIQIKVTVSDISQSNVVDDETAELDVDPKPVILVHGLWSDANTWDSYSGFLQNVRPDWFKFAIGDGQANGVMDTGSITIPIPFTSNTIAQNASELDTYIQEIRENENAWQVDIVAHSMGGIISRYYIQELMPDTIRPTISRLIMLGTPNGGSECANIITTANPLAWFPVMYQLRTDYLTWFNLDITERRGVEYSILAGNTYVLPCSPPEGDGIVSVESALAIPIVDNTSRTARFHDEMTGAEENFTLFVKPRLVGNGVSQRTIGSLSISQGGQVANSDPNLSYGEIIEILPTQTQVIQLPQLGGTQLNILLSNMSKINATLKDPLDAIVDNIDANSSRANQMFVSMSDENIAQGTYVLELTNIGSEAMTIPVAVWVENDPVELQLTVSNLGSQNQDVLSSNQVLVSAVFTDNDIPITGANLTAQLVDESGSKLLTDLFDDGNHADGKANDGVYGFVFESLAANTYIVKIQGESNETTRLTSSLINVDNRIFLPMIVR